MEAIKAIETIYNGYRFRSRLEARYAVAFDAMGIKYEYEPEGFTLRDGTKYLPDFMLTNVRHRSFRGDEFEPVYVEVKGMMSPADKHKAELFEMPLLIVGELPHGGEFPVGLDWLGETEFWTFAYIDGDYYPARFCEHKGEIWLAGPDHNQDDCGKLMEIGIRAAKQARFEHGEHGTTKRGFDEWEWNI